MKFDHLGVIAGDLASGRRLLAESLGVSRWTEEQHDPLQDVFVQFGLCVSGLCYEVIAPASAKSPVSGALAGRVNILNHVAYLVDDLAAERERLGSAGFVPIASAKPGVAFANHPIQFFISPARFMIELIEAPDHRHAFGRFAEASA